MFRIKNYLWSLLTIYWKGTNNTIIGSEENLKDENSKTYTSVEELEEETNICRDDTELTRFMDITYVKWDKELEVYYGILNKDVELIEEVNKLEWVSVDDDFFNMNKYAGEGNIGHIIEEIKIELNKNN